jgi:cell division transport system permease protein
MKGYGLFYYISESFRGLRANGLVNLLAVGTITMAMLLVGFFLLVFFNLRGTVSQMSSRLEVSVYLKDNVTGEEKDFLLARLKTEPGVKKVSYLPKGEALALFRKELKGQEALLEGLGENPLPDSFEVGLDLRAGGVERIEALAKKFSALPGVEDVSYGRQGAETLAFLLSFVTYGGAALALLLGVSVVFIISNSVRLALYSRGQEIELMQWIGATRGFIQGPFLFEGMLIAMLGSALGVGILAGVFYSLPQEAVLFLSRPYGLEFLPPAAIFSLILGGGLLGLTGASVSVGKFLE